MGYPICFVRPTERDLHVYLRNLEETLLRTVGDFGIAGGRNPGWTGAWTQALSGAPARKLASIGVAVKKWVTLHGFALNVSTDLARFSAINPCGLEAGVMGSISTVVGHPVDMGVVKQSVQRHFSEVFGRATLLA